MQQYCAKRNMRVRLYKKKVCMGMRILDVYIAVEMLDLDFPQ